MSQLSIGGRFKEYEKVWDIKLPRRMPVIARLDGRNFHGLTKNLECARPFDVNFSNSMTNTAWKLARETAGCKFAYTQSDEISLLITNDDGLHTEPYLGNEVQKLCSLLASAATEKFNTEEDLANGTFDCRVFVVPKDEVVNYFIWRQQDTTRNSVQMVAQANFSHRELQGLNSGQLQEKLWKEKGVNWNDTPTRFKRGVAVVKVEQTFLAQNHNPSEVGKIVTTEQVTRKLWKPDFEVPVFTQDREYIERHMWTCKRKASHLDKQEV